MAADRALPPAMIFNAYSILSFFVVVLELALGATLVVLGVRSWRRARRGGVGTDDPARAAMLLVAFALVVAGVGSWGLLYLLLDSYVPQWAGVMCIQGVTRIGIDAEGPARALPILVTALELVKPVVVSLGAVALLVHLVDRATPASPLSARLAILFAVAGALAVADAGTQAAYLTIPKRDRALDRGCCTADVAALDPLASERGRPASRTTVYGFFGATGAAILGLAWGRLARQGEASVAFSTALVGAAALGVWFGGRFLAEIAAPRLLPATAHPCGYCVLGGSTTGLVGIVLHVAGSVSAALSGALGLLARGHATGIAVLRPARALRATGVVAYAISLAAATVVSFRS